MTEITNLRAISDQGDFVHEFSLEPVSIGSVHQIGDKKYRAVKNTQTTIVSYKPLDDIHNSMYRGVKIYAIMEHHNYHPLGDDGMISFDIAEQDISPMLKYWNVYGCDGMIDTTLDVKDFPHLDNVKQYIDLQIEILGVE